ncbi:MAG TPA: hypothetical protein VD999_04620 [Vitreimonas sp.]|nr:hypothetical protein [Vitreimonas sp.]
MLNKLSSLFTRENLLLLALCLAAFLLRVYNISELMIFSYDQGRDMYVLQQITRGDVTLIGPTTGLPGFFLGPFFYYALLPGFIISNGSPIGVVIWQMFIIVATLPVLYYTLKPFVKPYLAWLALVLFALTPGALSQARNIWNPSWVAPVLILMTWSLFTSIRSSRWQPLWLALGLFCYGLSLQTEFAYAIFLAPVVGWWVFIHSPLYTLIRNRWTQTKASSIFSWQTLIIGCVAFAVTVAPQALFEFRNQFLMTNSLLKEMSDTSKQVPLMQIWRERPLLMFAELQNTLFALQTLSKLGVWLVISLLTYLAVQLRKTKHEWFVLLLVISPLVGMLLHRGNYGYFFNYYITAHYLPIIMALIFALHRYPWRKTASVIMIMLWSLGTWHYVSAIYHPSTLQYTIGHQLRALRNIRTMTTTEPIAIAARVPNLVPINYQYLNEWLARTQGERPVDFQVEAKHQEYFLLYEPFHGTKTIFFDPWYAEMTQGVSCGEPHQFGIISVEHCRRVAQ